MSDLGTDPDTSRGAALPIQAHSMSRADDLNFLGQQAVAAATTSDDDHRIVGGTMVRLLTLAYPTADARARTTVDADTAAGDLEVIGTMAERLRADDFTQEGGNLFVKPLEPERRIEVHLLLSRHGTTDGMQQQEVPGVGQVDTLPELVFALAQPPLELAMTVTLTTSEVIEYTTCIPGLEAATVLKAHAWKNRLAPKDLVDLSSLLEIREAHPHLPWRLNTPPLRATRRDAARILHTLRTGIPPRPRSQARDMVDRLRMSALIARHIATV